MVNEFVAKFNQLFGKAFPKIGGSAVDKFVKNAPWG
jgi:hypothetical protein